MANLEDELEGMKRQQNLQDAKATITADSFSKNAKKLIHDGNQALNNLVQRGRTKSFNENNLIGQL